MKETDVIKTLSEIKDLMEKSSKVLSLSGLSCILVGIYAFIGAGVAYYMLSTPTGYINYDSVTPVAVHINTPYRLHMVVGLALFLLAVSLATVFLMSSKKASKAGTKLISDSTTWRLVWNFFLPLFAGGILCIALLSQQHYGLTSSIMLIFYGLALINASKYTYANIRYLGYAQLLLGLTDSFVQGYGLLFWTIGFGLFHIVYGILFHLKYERTGR